MSLSLPRYCELAPIYGQASSEAGRFDARNSIQASCGHKVFATPEASFWFSLHAKEMNGSLYQPAETGLNVRDFQTRSIGFAWSVDLPLQGRWGLGLGLLNSWGQGSLKQTFSVNNLRQTLRFSDVKSRDWQVDLSSRYLLRPDLALVGSVSLGQEQWSWNPQKASYLAESVSLDKRLSLSDNPGTWQGTPVTGALRSQVRELKMAIRLLF
jgi:hypothetical protein